MSDYIYLVDLESILGSDELKPKDACCCTISSKNILAFSNDCYVFVVPLEKPNELIPITSPSSSHHKIRFLEWTDDGKYLMVVQKNGLVNIYLIRSNPLNSVELAYSYQIEKDDLAVVKPFTKSPKLCFNNEKSDSLNYLEKYFYKPFNFLKNYSKFQYNGFLLLTKRGTLHICITDYNSVKSRFEKFEYEMNLDKLVSMDQTQYELDLADFCLETDGSINVIFSNTNISSPIYIAKVNLRFSIDSLSMEGQTELLTSFDVSSSVGEMKNASKTRLHFTSNESSQMICVGLHSDETAWDVLQIWKPTALNQNNFIEISKETLGCTLIKEVKLQSQLVDISLPKSVLEYRDFSSRPNPMETPSYSVAPPFFICLAFQNGTTGFMNINEFELANSGENFMINTSSIPSRNSEDSWKSKRVRFVQEYCKIVDQSYSGSIAVGITNLSRLVLIRQPTLKSLQPVQIFNMYEYDLLTGRDYWDLLINTPVHHLESLIQTVEEKNSTAFPRSMQTIYLPKYRALLFSLTNLIYQSRKTSGITTSVAKYRPLEELCRLLIYKAMSVLSFSIQLCLDGEQISSQHPSVVSKQANQPFVFKTSILGVESLCQASLCELLTGVLSKNPDEKLNSSNLSDIVAHVTHNKSFQVVANQQVKHILQWVLDLALNLTRIVPQSRLKLSPNLFGSGLLLDLGFLNEIRKAIVYMKLLFVGANGSMLPILPLRSSVQKDLLADLFNIYSKIMAKIQEGASILNDESIMDSCLNIEAEAVIRSFDELFFHLKRPWVEYADSKPLVCSVNELFEQEQRQKKIYPLFDIARLIQFSRSSHTKQCIRCGNYTESQTMVNSKIAASSPNKTNCIYIQDSSSERCVCGGVWVQSSLQ